MEPSFDWQLASLILATVYSATSRSCFFLTWLFVQAALLMVWPHALKAFLVMRTVCTVCSVALGPLASSVHFMISSCWYILPRSSSSSLVKKVFCRLCRERLLSAHCWLFQAAHSTAHRTPARHIPPTMQYSKPPALTLPEYSKTEQSGIWGLTSLKIYGSGQYQAG